MDAIIGNKLSFVEVAWLTVFAIYELEKFCFLFKFFRVFFKIDFLLLVHFLVGIIAFSGSHLILSRYFHPFLQFHSVPRGQIVVICVIGILSFVAASNKRLCSSVMTKFVDGSLSAGRGYSLGRLTVPALAVVLAILLVMIAVF